MKFHMRLISIMVVLVMLLGSVTVAFAAEYQDVSKKHWAKADIEWATAQGLMNGTGEGKFSPEGSAERAMLVTILYRSAGEPAVSGTPPFPDLKQAWYKAPVAWAYQNGIVNGTSATTFGPSAKITREQLATILYRYTQNMLKYNVSVSGSLSAFPDQGKVSSYAKAGMLWANAVGLVNGNLKGGISYLEPKGNATRAQLAAIFHRFDTYREANKPADPSPTPTPTPEPEPEPTPPAPQGITIPDLTGKTKEEARAAISALGLYAAFNNGYDPAKPMERVIGQNPAAGSTARAGDTVTVTLNVKPEPQAVPDLIGMSRADAETALSKVNLTLTGTVRPYRLDAVPGLISSQNPAKGTKLEYGSAVYVEINGAPENIQLPDFRGMTREEAEAKAAELLIRLDFYTGEFTLDYPENTVTVQHSTGAFLQGKTLTLAMNGTPKRVTVPDLPGMTKAEALNALKALELRAAPTAAPYRLIYGAEEVYAQAIAKETELLQGSEVGFTFNGAPASVELPDFRGMTQLQAQAKANELQILVEFVGGTATVDYPAQTVAAQSVAAGNGIQQGTLLTLTVNGALQKATVPDFRGMTRVEAMTAALAAGLKATVEANTPDQYNSNYRADQINAQTQTAGTQVAWGTAVTLYLNTKPLITVPDLTGIPLTEAVATAATAGVYLEYTEDSDGEDGSAIITKQKPAAGTKMPIHETVTLTARGKKTSDFFTVGTYVVRHFADAAGEIKYSAIGAELALMDLDIVGLQEIDYKTTRANGDDQMAIIAEEAGYPYYAFGKAMNYNGGEYGHGILSKYEIKKAEVFPFETQGGEQRAYGRYEIDRKGTTLAVYVTSLDFKNNGVLTCQPQQLAEILAKMKEETAPTLLLGDLNLVPSGFAEVMEEGFTALNGGPELDQTVKTAPSGSGAKYPLDNIIVSDQLTYLTDDTAPTGLYVNVTDNSHHNLAYAYLALAGNGNNAGTVPDFVGMTKRQAIAAAAEAGFAVQIWNSYNLGTASGLISGQSVGKGYRRPAGSVIDLNYNQNYDGYLKVASYNVKRFMDSSQFDQIAAEVLTFEPDIIGFQEVDINTGRNPYDQMKEIASRTGYPYAYFGKAINYSGGQYGHGFLSKYPLQNTETVLFQSQNCSSGEKRSYDRTQITVKGVTYTVYNMHLALSPDSDTNKTAGTSQLKEALDRAKDDAYPIVMGDMNAQSRFIRNVVDTTVFTCLNGGKNYDGVVNTFPQGSAPYTDIDHIIVKDTMVYATDEKTGAGLFVNKTDLSDHNMIYTFVKPRA